MEAGVDWSMREEGESSHKRILLLNVDCAVCDESAFVARIKISAVGVIIN